jgi:hypothetical protein
MNQEFVEAYLAFVELAIILAAPLMGLLTLFSWYLAFKTWPLQSALLIAVCNTVILSSAGWLAWSVLYRSRIGVVPIEFLPITATAVLMLCVVPFFLTVYLLVLTLRASLSGGGKVDHREAFNGPS